MTRHTVQCQCQHSEERRRASRTRDLAMDFLGHCLFILFAVVVCVHSAVRETHRCPINGDIRLVGFNSTAVGYVEMCREHIWRRVVITDQGTWSRKDSIVACRQLGYLNALNVQSNDRYIHDPAVGVEPLYHHSVECTGLEDRLLDCKTSDTWNRSESTMFSALRSEVVVCVEAPRRGDIRLVGSGSDSEGVLEVYHPNRVYRWSTVCTNQWSDTDASVACRQLGFKTGRSITERGNQYLLPRKRYDNYVCDGSEASLSGCSFDGPYPIQCYSSDNRFAGVVCQDNDQDSEGTSIIEPAISWLVLITGVILLLITLGGIVLRCAVKRYGKKSPLPTHTSSSNQPGGGQRPSRVTLGSQYWQQNETFSASVLGADAPPTYEETVSADQEHTSTNNLSENGDAPDVVTQDNERAESDNSAANSQETSTPQSMTHDS